MAEINIEEVRQFLSGMQGQRITLNELRTEFQIISGTKSFNSIRMIMSRLVDQKIVRPIGARAEYKVIKQVKPVKVFGRERRKPITFMFPKDYDTGMEMAIADDIVFREGDLILLSGSKNQGKTCLCMNFCGENIEWNPILMGNEYTNAGDEPTSRFLSRIDAMDWIQWANGTGEDNFTLLPVRADFAEHIIKDRMNIIDWINIDTGEHFMIGNIMESIKRNLGKGVAIVAIQKAEGAEAGRGGQFTKDFADCELLLDKFGDSDNEVLLKVGYVKEPKRRIMGRTFAYRISQGVKIIKFREVVKCPECYGKGWRKSGNSSTPCENCYRIGYVDR